MKKNAIKIFNVVNTPPRPQTCTSSYISYSWLLTNDAGQQLHKCSYALKFKILGQKCPCVSLNVILYNSSVNKKLTLLYFKHNIVFLLNFAENILPFKAIGELLCIFEQHSGV